MTSSQHARPGAGRQGHRVDLRGKQVDGAEGLQREPIEQLGQLIATVEMREQVKLLDFDSALEKLREESERQFETVMFRFYGGMTMEQIAEVHEVSITTTEKDWRLARAKLHRQLRAYGGAKDQTSEE